MIALHYIKENKEVVLEGLRKRNFKALEIIDQIIELDKERRAQQANLDKHLAKANILAKEIGMFFKNGDEAKANLYSQY